MWLRVESEYNENLGWQHGKVFRDFVDFRSHSHNIHNEMDIAWNDSTNKYASASSCTSPCSAAELQIHTVGCALKHHIMNIEINTKWLNNSSGDRAG